MAESLTMQQLEENLFRRFGANYYDPAADKLDCDEEIAGILWEMIFSVCDPHPFSGCWVRAATGQENLYKEVANVLSPARVGGTLGHPGLNNLAEGKGKQVRHHPLRCHIFLNRSADSSDDNALHYRRCCRPSHLAYGNEVTQKLDKDLRTTVKGQLEKAMLNAPKEELEEIANHFANRHTAIFKPELLPSWNLKQQELLQKYGAKGRTLCDEIDRIGMHKLPKVSTSLHRRMSACTIETSPRRRGSVDISHAKTMPDLTEIPNSPAMEEITHLNEQLLTEMQAHEETKKKLHLLEDVLGFALHPDTTEEEFNAVKTILRIKSSRPLNRNSQYFTQG